MPLAGLDQDIDVSWSALPGVTATAPTGGPSELTALSVSRFIWGSGSVHETQEENPEQIYRTSGALAAQDLNRGG